MSWLHRALSRCHSPPGAHADPAAQPALRDTRDIDDWLAIIAAGGGVGITPEGTTAQYRRDGVVFRPLRDAPPIVVQMIWRRHDPHPSTHAAVALLTELYRRPS
jgi:LysR substrate binding domain